MKSPKIYINFYGSAWLILLLISCNTPKNITVQNPKTPDEKGSDTTYIIEAPIVAKSFYKKNGVKLDFQEYYIQRSVQDYFIKFCEGNVLRKDLEEALSKIPGEIKSIKMEVEFREGLWDVCDENREQQSRVGKYAVIHKLL